MQMTDQSVRFKFVENRVKQVFADHSHLTPAVFADRAFGWKEERTYKHTSPSSTKKFPLPLVRVGSQQMVSAVDYFDFLFVGSTPPAAVQSTVKKQAGRKSNQSKAQVNGGAHV